MKHVWLAWLAQRLVSIDTDLVYVVVFQCFKIGERRSNFGGLVESGEIVTERRVINESKAKV